MKQLCLTVTLVLSLGFGIAAKADLALFNGFPVDARGNSTAATTYNRMQAALERGEPQTLIIEYLGNGKGNSSSQKLAAYDRIKSSALHSFDPTAIIQLLDYSHLPMSMVRVNSSHGLEQLMRHSQVKAVYEDTRNQLFLTQSLPLIQQPAAATQGGTGAGTAIAVLDTGVDYTHTAFGSCTQPGEPESCKVAYVQDFAPEDGALDAHGHGTNVSGIGLGVAPGASILALDVFDGNSALSSDIIDAINWSISNRDVYNIAAINMSLGAGRYFAECSTDVFATPISAAKAAGILVAVASGNDGYKDSMASPACAPDAVSVGAVYDADMDYKFNWGVCSEYPAVDQVTCFSDSAPFLDLLAPGAAITAAGITMRGTSQAAPHVAGAAAVLAQVFPAESPEQWLFRLKAKGLMVTDEGNGISTARVDIGAAFNEASTPCTGDVLDIDTPIYYSGEIESCVATSLIDFGPDITVSSGAMVSLTSPEVAISAPISIANGAIFAIKTPGGVIRSG